MPRCGRPQAFEELEHTADAGVRVRGDHPAQLLARVVVVMGELLTGEQGALAPCDERKVTAEPADLALMAVDILRELLYAFDVDGVVPTWCEPELLDPERGARARVGLGRYDPEAHGSGSDIKAVTLHGARFEPEGDGWVAEIVFDV